jgi:hypothetical protein
MVTGDASELLASVVRGRLDERVRDRIIAEARAALSRCRKLPRGLQAA